MTQGRYAIRATPMENCSVTQTICFKLSASRGSGIARNPMFHTLGSNGRSDKKNARRRGRDMTNHTREPLSAARGMTLGCLLSSVIWLAGLNIVLLGGNFSF